MPSMLETLIGSGVVRPDNKRIVPSRRPLPGRPRDLLELFSALGQQATFQSLMSVCDLRQADFRQMTFITLSRWPTGDELAAAPAEYNVRTHLNGLLMGQEFRAHLARRICDAYPERPRLLYVRIPRCAGTHFSLMASSMHAFMPPSLDQWRARDLNAFLPALGTYLGRFNIERTTGFSKPSLAAFMPVEVSKGPDETLPWTLNPPPCRNGDRLFTIVREPTGLILGQVNAILAALRETPADPELADWRRRLGALPPEQNAKAWKALGLQVLAQLPQANPICTALGQGTAQSAIDACRLSDVEINELSRYADWVKFTWNVEPEGPANTAPPIITPDDLDAPARSQLDRLTHEDRRFHEAVASCMASLDPLRTFIRGRDL